MHVSREGRGKAKKGYKTEMGRRVYERLGIVEGRRWLGELKDEAGVGCRGSRERDWRMLEMWRAMVALRVYGAEILDMETAAQASERVQSTSGSAACSVQRAPGEAAEAEGCWPLFYGTRMAVSRSTSECESSN
jgi:hypothetical protein